MSIKLPFGLRDGRVVTIREVERGLACNCICPACRRPLIAKKGALHVHHFAHYAGESCAFGLETALHYRAKQVLEAERRLRLPAVYLPGIRRPLWPAQMITFDRVWLEWRSSTTMVPDLLVRTGGRWLLLEIAVTHPVDEQKLQRIRTAGEAALEIDVRELAAVLYQSKGAFDDQEFSRRLIYGLQHKRWLFNPRREALEARLFQEATHRRVAHRRYGDVHVFTVHPCPQGRRLRQINPVQSWTFARVFDDCLHCPYCLEIQYQSTFRGFREVPGLPETVICWGDRPELPDQWKERSGSKESEM